MEKQQRGLQRIKVAINAAGEAVAFVPEALQPTVLALLLALLAWPIVATGWGFGYRDQYVSGSPISGLAWSAAGGGVLLSALVAGPVGGFVVRRSRVAGAIFTYVLALAVAIMGAELVPAYLGQTACGGVSASCTPATTTARVFIEDLQSLPLLVLFAPLVEPVAVLILAIGVVLWSGALGAGRSVRTDH